MILLLMNTMRSSLDYRLRNYYEFKTMLPDMTEEEVVVYDLPTTKNIDEIIDEVGKPRVIMMWWPEIGASDFTKHKAKVYTYITDCPSMNLAYHEQMDTHKVKFEAVLFNYFTEQHRFDSFFDTKKYIYYPDWASHIYDYKEQGEPKKKIDFLISGNGSAVYPQRKLYLRAVEGLSYIGNVKPEGLMNVEEENKWFLNTVLNSKYSPHDGGPDGRLVPRFYESSFAKSVIVCPLHEREMKEAGFVDGKNIIITPTWSLKYSHSKEAKEYMKKIADRKDWKSLSEEAYNLVATRHTTDKRIEQFLDIIN